VAEQHGDGAFDAALDELYGAPPGDFVLTRARLERELKAAGHQDHAAAIRRLRKPGLAVWAGNQLAREDPDGIDELLSATDSVRAAQHALLQGGNRDDLRDETRARQELLDELVGTGVQLLVGHAPKPATYRDDLANLLEAASLDPGAAETLRAGRLTRLLAPTAGFDALGEPPPNVQPIRRARDEPAHKAPSRKDQRALEAARRDVEEARRRAQAASEAAEEADAESASAGIAADTAVARLADIERALTQARDDQRTTTRRAGEARSRATAAHKEAEAAAERRRRAEERLRGVERPGR
jgi:hypothetical protein